MAAKIKSGGGGNQGQNFGGQTNRGNVNIFLVPKDERTRSSDQIAIDLRNQLRGIPGVVTEVCPISFRPPLSTKP